MKNKLTIRTGLLMLCLIGSIQVFGQDRISPQKKALIKEFLNLIDATKAAETTIRQIQQQLRGATSVVFAQGLRELLASEKMAPTDRTRAEARVNEAAERVVERIQIEIPKRINYAEVLEQVLTEIYDKHFTEEDLKELVALYKTPTAQKFVKLAPQMSVEAMPKVQEMILPTITQTITEIVEDEKKKIIAK